MALWRPWVQVPPGPMHIPFYKHSITKKEIKAVIQTLKDPFITTGPKNKLFEHLFSKYLNVKFTSTLSSCTAGLFLTLKAWNISKDDKVIVPTLSFVATANVVLHTQATPIFVDSSPKTGLLDLNQVEDLLKKHKNIKVIIPVHLYGQMVDMKGLRYIADKFGVKILEDSAHCIEGERDGIKPGQLGDSASFSFYATKNITCGEGGAIATNNEELYEKINILKLHGLTKNAYQRYQRFTEIDMIELGYKYNLTDIQASILIEQLKRIGKLWEKRRKVYERYKKLLSGLPIEFPEIEEGVKHAYHLFVIFVPKNLRDNLINYLQDNGIGVSIHFKPIHLMSYYRKVFGYKEGDFPVAEDIGSKAISLPFYPSLKFSEQKYVAEVIKRFFEKYG